jgi:hypothetical protein
VQQGGGLFIEGGVGVTAEGGGSRAGEGGFEQAQVADLDVVEDKFGDVEQFGQGQVDHSPSRRSASA